MALRKWAVKQVPLFEEGYPVVFTSPEGDEVDIDEVVSRLNDMEETIGEFEDLIDELREMSDV